MKKCIRLENLPENSEKQVLTGAFGRLKPHNKPNATETWLQLERTGLSSKSVNCNFTGTVTLNIKRSGIANIKEFGSLPSIMEQELDSVPDETRFRFPKGKYAGKDLGKIKQARKLEALKSSSSYASRIKEVFKTGVLPSIKKSVPSCGDRFDLKLHYSDRTLLYVDLEHWGVNQ